MKVSVKGEKAKRMMKAMLHIHALHIIVRDTDVSGCGSIGVKWEKARLNDEAVHVQSCLADSDTWPMGYEASLRHAT